MLTSNYSPVASIEDDLTVSETVPEVASGPTESLSEPKPTVEELAAQTPAVADETLQVGSEPVTESPIAVEEDVVLQQVTDDKAPLDTEEHAVPQEDTKVDEETLVPGAEELSSIPEPGTTVKEDLPETAAPKELSSDVESPLEAEVSNSEKPQEALATDEDISKSVNATEPFEAISKSEIGTEEPEAASVSHNNSIADVASHETASAKVDITDEVTMIESDSVPEPTSKETPTVELPQSDDAIVADDASAVESREVPVFQAATVVPLDDAHEIPLETHSDTVAEDVVALLQEEAAPNPVSELQAVDSDLVVAKSPELTAVQEPLAVTLPAETDLGAEVDSDAADALNGIPAEVESVPKEVLIEESVPAEEGQAALEDVPSSQPADEVITVVKDASPQETESDVAAEVANDEKPVVKESSAEESVEIQSAEVPSETQPAEEAIAASNATVEDDVSNQTPAIDPAQNNEVSIPVESVTPADEPINKNIAIEDVVVPEAAAEAVADLHAEPQPAIVRDIPAEVAAQAVAAEDEPIVEEASATEVAAPEPVVEEPSVEEPTTQEQPGVTAVTSESVIEPLVSEVPVSDDAAPELPVEEALAVPEEAASEKPVDEAPVGLTGETFIQEPVVETAIPEEAAPEATPEAVVEEVAVAPEEAVADDHVLEAVVSVLDAAVPVSEIAITETAVTAPEEAVAKETIAEEPATEEVAADSPVIGVVPVPETIPSEPTVEDAIFKEPVLLSEEVASDVDIPEAAVPVPEELVTDDAVAPQKEMPAVPEEPITDDVVIEEVMAPESTPKQLPSTDVVSEPTVDAPASGAVVPEAVSEEAVVEAPHNEAVSEENADKIALDVSEAIPEEVASEDIIAPSKQALIVSEETADEGTVDEAASAEAVAENPTAVPEESVEEPATEATVAVPEIALPEKSAVEQTPPDESAVEEILSPGPSAEETSGVNDVVSESVVESPAPTVTVAEAISEVSPEAATEEAVVVPEEDLAGKAIPEATVTAPEETVVREAAPTPEEAVVESSPIQEPREEAVVEQILRTVSDETVEKTPGVEEVASIAEVSSPEPTERAIEQEIVAAVEESSDAPKIAGIAVAAGGLAALAGLSIHALAKESPEAPATTDDKSSPSPKSRELVVEPKAAAESDVEREVLPPSSAAPEVGESQFSLVNADAQQPNVEPLATVDLTETDEVTADSLSEEYVLVEASSTPDVEDVASPTEEATGVEQSIISLDKTDTVDKAAVQSQISTLESTAVSDVTTRDVVSVEEPVLTELIEAPAFDESSKVDADADVPVDATRAVLSIEEADTEPAASSKEPTVDVIDVSSQQPAADAVEAPLAREVEEVSATPVSATAPAESVEQSVLEPTAEVSLTEVTHAVQSESKDENTSEELSVEPAVPEVSRDGEDLPVDVQPREIVDVIEEKQPRPAKTEEASSVAPISDEALAEALHDSERALPSADIVASAADTTTPKDIKVELPVENSASEEISNEVISGEPAILERSVEAAVHPIAQHDAELDAQPGASPTQSPTRNPILSAAAPDAVALANIETALPAAEEVPVEGPAVVAVAPKGLTSLQQPASDLAAIIDAAPIQDTKGAMSATEIEAVQSSAFVEPDAVPAEKSLLAESLVTESELDKELSVEKPIEPISKQAIPDVEEATLSERLSRDLPVSTALKTTTESEQDVSENSSYAKEIGIGAGVVGALGVAVAVAAHQLPSTKEPETPKTVKLLEEYAARLEASDDPITPTRDLTKNARSLSIESSQIVDETVPLSESFHVIERESPAREEAAKSTEKKEASSEYGEKIDTPSTVRGGIKTDDVPETQRPLTPTRLIPRGLNTEFRVPTPAVVLPDLDDPLAKQMSRVRSIRRQRRNTIKQAEEMVAAAVVIYATAEVLSPPASPTLESPPEGFGSTKMHSDTEGKGKGKDVETPVLPRQASSAPVPEAEDRGRTRSRDIGAVQEGELLYTVADLSVDDKGKSRDASTTKTDDAKPSSPRRNSHHSSRHRSHRDSRDGSKEGSRHTHSRRSDSHTSVRSATDSRPRTPTKTDTALPESNGSPRTRRRRTPEEQEAHDKRKEERRRLRELEKAKEEAAPASPGKDRSIPKSSSSSRDRPEHHRHHSSHSSRRHSRTSVEPKLDVPPSPAASKKFFDIKNGESVIESNFVAKEAAAKDSVKDVIPKEVSMPPSSSKTPTELKRSSTSRSTRLRKSEDRSGRLHRSRDDVGSKAKETKESLASASKTRETISSAVKTRESLSSAAKTKESVTSVGASSSTASGDGEGRHRAKREERRREREDKDKKPGIRAAIKRFFTN